MITVQMPVQRVLQGHLKDLERLRRRTRRNYIWMIWLVSGEVLLSIFDGLYASELQMWMRVITIIGMSIVLWVSHDAIAKVDDALSQLKKVMEIEEQLTRAGIPTSIEAQARL